MDSLIRPKTLSSKITRYIFKRRKIFHKINYKKIRESRKERKIKEITQV